MNKDGALQPHISTQLFNKIVDIIKIMNID
jgi:hypothetical protein